MKKTCFRLRNKPTSSPVPCTATPFAGHHSQPGPSQSPFFPSHPAFRPPFSNYFFPPPPHSAATTAFGNFHPRPFNTFMEDISKLKVCRYFSKTPSGTENRRKFFFRLVYFRFPVSQSILDSDSLSDSFNWFSIQSILLWKRFRNRNLRFGNGMGSTLFTTRITGPTYFPFCLEFSNQFEFEFIKISSRIIGNSKIRLESLTTELIFFSDPT